MPRSLKSSQVETNLFSSAEGWEQRLETYDLRFGSLDATLGDIQKNYSDLKLDLMSTVAQINTKLEAALVTKPTGDGGGTSRGPQPGHPQFGSPSHNQLGRPSTQLQTTTTGTASMKTPKLNFPRFNGENPRGWVRKCEQYFDFCPIHEDFMVAYASVHFDEQVEYWYSTYIKPLGTVRWKQFVEDLYARFSNLSRDSVIGEFNQLKQVASVGEYYNYFEELRAQVVDEFDILDEGYFVKSFVGGLKPEIRSRVEQFEVTTLSKAIHIARKEEIAIHNLFRQPKPSNSSSFHTSPNQPRIIPSFNPKSLASPVTNVPFQTKQLATNPRFSQTSQYHKGILPTPPTPPWKPNQPIKHLTFDEQQLKREQVTREIHYTLMSRCPPETITIDEQSMTKRSRGSAVMAGSPITAEQRRRCHSVVPLPNIALDAMTTTSTTSSQ
ncbi:hypothetical protein RJ640_016948 [Escallonia rubra]|uniref:Ty3 transposon capsid-like protein domain-containing protein n=1 Tax=Escallonia rubra TaxID=112253 RepID=A0AA88RDU8_9ASTE|nr:hypothetical protein RJ640_016948 [Escallonia rubra]